MSQMRRRLPLLLLCAGALFVATGCGSDDGPATTTTATPAAQLDRVEFERSGGVAAPREPDRIVVTERADLDRLASLIPRKVPTETTGGPTGCADCRSYTLTLISGSTVRTSTFDEVSIPPAYQALVAELSSRL